MPARMPNIMPDKMSEYMLDRMPYDMSEYMSGRMPDRLPHKLSAYMSGTMPGKTSKHVRGNVKQTPKMSEYM